MTDCQILSCLANRLATRKAGRPRLGWEDVIYKDLKEMGSFWEGVKKEALNRLD